MGSEIGKVCEFRTMLLIILCSVFVGALGVNVTEKVVEGGSRSKMVWMKMLLDHHDWDQSVVNKTELPTLCKNQVTDYVNALNDGIVWASKMYDASGHYTPNILFGSDYWLGSIDACKDIQLRKYYDIVPPFPLSFFVAKFNMTVDDGHLPQSRILLVGQCLPSSCGKEGAQILIAESTVKALSHAVANDLPASLQLMTVRPVPGPYNMFADPKVLILGSTVILVLTLMLAASLYEGFLERRWRTVRSAALKDLELNNQNNNLSSNNDNNNKNISTDSYQIGGKTDNETEESKDLRRENCGFWGELLLSFSILSNGRTILSTHKPADGALTCVHGMRFLSVTWVIMVHTYLTVFYVSDNKTLRTVTERNFMYQSVGNASFSVDTFFFIGGLLVTILFLRSEDKKQAKRLQKKPQLVNKNINGFTNSALSVSVISQTSFGRDLMDKPKLKIYTKTEFLRICRTFFVMVFYRFIRLTPAYGFVIGLNEIALRYTHNSTVFEPAIFDQITCDLFWWRNLLYINNLYPQREMCMVWSWYMANDTQFYVVGILLLLISVKHFKFSVITLGLILVSSWVTTMYISVWHQYRARIQEPFEMFDALYDKPWSRIGPYFIGMAVAYYLHKTKCQIKIPYWLVVVGWPASIAVMGSLIFGMVDGYFEVWPTAFYVSVGHTAWGCALAWVTIACCAGYGGLANSALSYHGLLPLSRLTYCAYLVHPTIMMYITFLMDGPLHLQNSIVVKDRTEWIGGSINRHLYLYILFVKGGFLSLSLYAGFAVLAFLSSFAISIAFEAPAVRLLKIISGGSRSVRSECQHSK